MLSQDAYRHGLPLSREGLFQMVMEEAFRDGRIDDRDNQILCVLLRFLRFEQQDAMTIARTAKAKFEQGILGPARPFRPLELYKRVLRYVFLGRQPGPIELKMVQGIRALFRISSELHDLAIQQIRQAPHITQNFPIRRKSQIQQALAPIPNATMSGEIAAIPEPMSLASAESCVELSQMANTTETGALPITTASAATAIISEIVRESSAANAAIVPSQEMAAITDAAPETEVTPKSGETAVMDRPTRRAIAEAKKEAAKQAEAIMAAEAKKGGVMVSFWTRIEKIPTWARIGMLSFAFVSFICTALTFFLALQG